MMDGLPPLLAARRRRDRKSPASLRARTVLAHLYVFAACEVLFCCALRMSLVSGRSALICLTERGENRWNSNERDDSVVSWINDRDRVICGVDRVEQTGQLRYFARKIVRDAFHS
jgi:hypothetical protein